MLGLKALGSVLREASSQQQAVSRIIRTLELRESRKEPLPCVHYGLEAGFRSDFDARCRLSQLLLVSHDISLFLAQHFVTTPPDAVVLATGQICAGGPRPFSLALEAKSSQKEKMSSRSSKSLFKLAQALLIS